MWPSPEILQAVGHVGGKLRVSNNTTDPIILKKMTSFAKLDQPLFYLTPPFVPIKLDKTIKSHSV